MNVDGVQGAEERIDSGVERDQVYSHPGSEKGMSNGYKNASRGETVKRPMPIFCTRARLPGPVSALGPLEDD